jgi:hypothetical protein
MLSKTFGYFNKQENCVTVTFDIQERVITGFKTAFSVVFQNSLTSRVSCCTMCSDVKHIICPPGLSVSESCAEQNTFSYLIKSDYLILCHHSRMVLRDSAG